MKHNPYAKYNRYNKITHMHHTVRYFPVVDCWVIADRGHEVVAVVTTSTTNHATRIAVTLILDKCELPLDPVVRPGGTCTALRWACQELNNGHLWLSTRLALEREARLLDYDEPELLACGHAYDYQYCLRLLANLPGLSENWPKR